MILGVPSLSDGSQIPGTSIVEDSNPSAVGQLLGLINPGNEVGSNSTGSGGDLDQGQLGGGLPDTGSLNGGNLNDIPTLGGDGLPDLGGGSPTGGESLDDIPSLGGEGTTNNVPDDFPDMGLGNSDVGTTPAISIENTVSRLEMLAGMNLIGVFLRYTPAMILVSLVPGESLWKKQSEHRYVLLSSV